VELQKTKANSKNSWSVDAKDINQITFDLSVKNPNKTDEVALREPKDILEEMRKLDDESQKIMQSILKNI
jgi:type I restriction enzyme M protein